MEGSDSPPARVVVFRFHALRQCLQAPARWVVRMVPKLQFLFGQEGLQQVLRGELRDHLGKL